MVKIINESLSWQEISTLSDDLLKNKIQEDNCAFLTKLATELSATNNNTPTENQICQIIRILTYVNTPQDIMIRIEFNKNISHLSSFLEKAPHSELVTAFNNAVAQDRPETAARLVAHMPANFSFKGPNDESILFWAARHDCVDLIINMVKREGKKILLHTDAQGRNLLHVAVDCNAVNVIERLSSKYKIKIFPQLIAKDQKGVSPFELIARYHFSILDLLMTKVLFGRYVFRTEKLFNELMDICCEIGEKILNDFRSNTNQDRNSILYQLSFLNFLDYSLKYKQDTALFGWQAGYLDVSVPFTNIVSQLFNLFLDYNLILLEVLTEVFTKQRIGDLLSFPPAELSKNLKQVDQETLTALINKIEDISVVKDGDLILTFIKHLVHKIEPLFNEPTDFSTFVCSLLKNYMTDKNFYIDNIKLTQKEVLNILRYSNISNIYNSSGGFSNFLAFVDKYNLKTFLLKKDENGDTFFHLSKIAQNSEHLKQLMDYDPVIFAKATTAKNNKGENFITCCSWTGDDFNKLINLKNYLPTELFENMVQSLNNEGETIIQSTYRQKSGFLAKRLEKKLRKCLPTPVYQKMLLAINKKGECLLHYYVEDMKSEDVDELLSKLSEDDANRLLKHEDQEGHTFLQHAAQKGCLRRFLYINNFKELFLFTPTSNLDNFVSYLIALHSPNEYGMYEDTHLKKRERELLLQKDKDNLTVFEKTYLIDVKHFAELAYHYYGAYYATETLCKSDRPLLARAFRDILNWDEDILKTDNFPLVKKMVAYDRRFLFTTPLWPTTLLDQVKEIIPEGMLPLAPFLTYRLPDEQPLPESSIKDLEKILNAFALFINDHPALTFLKPLSEQYVFQQSLSPFVKSQNMQLLAYMAGVFLDYSPTQIASLTESGLLKTIMDHRSPHQRTLLVRQLSYTLDNSQSLATHSSKKEWGKLADILLIRLQELQGIDLGHIRALVDDKTVFKDTKCTSVLLDYLEELIDHAPLSPEDFQLVLDKLAHILTNIPNLKIASQLQSLTNILVILGKEKFITCLNTYHDYEKCFDDEFEKLFKLDNIKNISEKYSRTFGEFRDKKALFTYLKSVRKIQNINEQEAVHNCLNEYVRAVLENNFHEIRYSEDRSTHLKTIFEANPQMKATWLNNGTFKDVKLSGKTQAIDYHRFFYEKMVRDKHLDPSEFPVLNSYLKKQPIQWESELQKIISSAEANPTEIQNAQFQLETLKLITKSQSLKSFLSNISAFTLPNEFKNDLKVLASSSKASKLYIGETDHFGDLIVIGTEIQGSCQRVDGDPKLNKCLPSYMLNGEIKPIVIKDKETGKIVARAVMRLMWDDKNNQPVLLLERVYSNIKDKAITKALIAWASEKAIAMGIPLVSIEVGNEVKSPYRGSDYDGNVTFLGGLAPFVYTDAGGGVHSTPFSLSKCFHIILSAIKAKK